MMEAIHDLISVLRNPSSFEWVNETIIIAPFGSTQTWMYTIVIYYSMIAFYVLLIKPNSNSHTSSSKENSFLNSIGFLHNIILSLLSLVMFLAITYETFDYISLHSFKDSLCISRDTMSFSTSETRIRFWLYIFYLSKFYELIDTFLLIIRRKPLTLLHVWHHASVIVETWSWIQYRMIFCVYGMMFNSFVHILMYFYFGCSLVHIKLPKWFRQSITSIQIIQFITSFIFAIPYVVLLVTQPNSCYGIEAFYISILCNGSYLALFIRFYIKSYNSKPIKTQ
mmetsp:Transcript_5466/g.9635  ORF Transcript_5466/g.9635 Transcript_5466/m.9635 type:complete len:281 (+) Transcript_5466:154-996(+)